MSFELNRRLAARREALPTSPPVDPVTADQKRRDVIHMVERNNRFPSFSGDLAAMIGAVERSAQMLEQLIGKWGAETVKAAINHAIDHSERRFREEVSHWPDGSYAATVLIDHDTVGT